MAASVAATPGPLPQPRHSWADCECPFRTWRRSGLPILATPTAQPLAADDARLVLEHSPSVERRRTCYKAPSFCDRDCVNRRSGKSWPRVDHHWHNKMRPGTARCRYREHCVRVPPFLQSDRQKRPAAPFADRRKARATRFSKSEGCAQDRDRRRPPQCRPRLRLSERPTRGPLLGADRGLFRPPWIH